jgi:glycosyltransferase involved in cell wall biosynthesis
LGVEAQVRFVPGHFTAEETAELFAAADVVALPYAESDGSGLLLLAMAFGVHIMATRVGGMDEYLARYPAHTVLDGADAAQVAAGLAAARASATAAPTARGRQTPPDELQWPNVAPLMLAALTEGAADWPESRV